jgi:hypothetical protein
MEQVAVHRSDIPVAQAAADPGLVVQVLFMERLVAAHMEIQVLKHPHPVIKA